jgi:hypothetical protein
MSGDVTPITMVFAAGLTGGTSRPVGAKIATRAASGPPVVETDAPVFGNESRAPEMSGRSAAQNPLDPSSSGLTATTSPGRNPVASMTPVNDKESVACRTATPSSQ